MKIINTLFVLLCICYSTSLHSQELKLELSTPGKIKDASSHFHRYGKYIYSDKTNWAAKQFALTATLKKVHYGLDVIQYDDQLNEQKKLSLDNDKDLGPFMPIVHYGENAIYAMYFKFVDDKVKMYVSKINPDDLSVVATKEVMDYDQRNQGFWNLVNTVYDAESFYTVSPDGKNAWIVHASPTLLLTTVIDADLNIVQKAESVPVKLKRLKITGAEMNNAGDKVLAFYFDDAAMHEFFRRGLFVQPANSAGSFKNVELPESKFPGNLQLAQSRDGQKLYIGGEYFGEDYSYGGQGVMLGEVNLKNGSIGNLKFHPYTNELRQRVYDLDFASKRKGQIIFTDHHLNYKIVEMEDKTIVLSSDMQDTQVGTHVSYTYFGPIVHVFLKPDGNATMTLIPKKQSGTSYTSFFNYLYKDKLICIYADIPKYQEKVFADKDISTIRSLSDIVPVANIYASDGKLVSRKMLINNKDQMKGNVLIGNVSKIGDNRFLMPIGESKVNLIKYYLNIDQICYLEIL